MERAPAPGRPSWPPGMAAGFANDGSSGRDGPGATRRALRAAVFRFEPPLRREEAGRPRRLAPREARTGGRHAGTAADGAGFVAFFRRGGAVAS